MIADDLDSDDALDRVNLRALDGASDALAGEQFVASVMARIATSTLTPGIPVDPLFGLWSLPRTILLAASILVIVALEAPRALTRAGNAAPTTIAEAVGVPSDYLRAGAPEP